MTDTDPTAITTRVLNAASGRPDEDAIPVPASEANTEEVSELARHSDPSQAKKFASAKTPDEATEQARRGVVWVRPSELMSQVTAKAAGRGIDFHAELARRVRHPAVQAVAASRRAISERAHRLPPVTAFGRRGHSPTGATQSGIGLR